MTPVAATILQVTVPFRFAFEHVLASRARTESLVLVLRDRTGRVGHGECAPRRYVSGETLATATAALEGWLANGILGTPFGGPAQLRAFLAERGAALARSEHAAFCALELALLDLGGRVWHRSAGEVVGAQRRPVRYSGVVPAGDPESVVRACTAIAEIGVPAVKAKVGRGQDEDLQVLRLVRERLGRSVSLRVDANCAWDAETALARLEAFAELGIDAVEQPCAADDFAGLARVTAESRVPVIVDESLVSRADAEALIEAGACRGFNIRISKCGGLVNACAIRDLGRRAGIRCMLGAQVGETAILAAAGRHFATGTEDLWFAEGSYGSMLLVADVADETRLERGALGRPLPGPGLGISADLRRIAAHVAEACELVC